MPSIATATANSIMNYVLRGTAYVPPGSFYVALFTTPVTNSTLGTEVAGGSYARQAVTFNAASGGSCTNVADVTILNMPAVTVVAVAVMSALTGGTHLWYGTVNKPTNGGDTFTIRAGDLNVGLLV